MSVGAELRAGRERAGLTVEQIGDRIKIQPQKIDALENGQFEHLPNGIYLDGIVRAYAKEVGVDAGPLIQRVRDDQVRVIHDLYAAPGDLDGFASEETATSAPDPPEQPRAIAPPATVAPPPKFEAPRQQIALPVAWDVIAPQESQGSADNTRRLGLLALTLSLIAAIGWLAFLYQRTVPPDRAASAPAPPSRPAASLEAATVPASPASAHSVGTAGSVPNVSGSWTLATRLESTNYARFSGLQLGYEIQLKQTGDRVTGAGRKVTENSRGLRGRAQTPISVAGTIEGDRLTLSFTERGARRPTQGKFVLLLEEDGAMRGRFSSSAAQSAGTVEARRIR